MVMVQAEFNRPVLKSNSGVRAADFFTMRLSFRCLAKNSLMNPSKSGSGTGLILRLTAALWRPIEKHTSLCERHIEVYAKSAFYRTRAFL